MSSNPQKSVEQLQTEFEKKLRKKEKMWKIFGGIPHIIDGNRIITYISAGMYYSVKIINSSQYELTISDTCNEKEYIKNIPYKKRSNDINITLLIKQNTLEAKAFQENL